ncbi:MAG: HD-GYP domain-containing protein, partial [Candidatus Zixiibacteriota bacterium]
AAIKDLDAIGAAFSFQSGSLRIDSFSELRLPNSDRDARTFLESPSLGLDYEEVRQRIVKADVSHGQPRTFVSLPLRSGDSFFGWLKIVFGRGCRDAEMRVLELLTASASAAVGRTLLNERLTESNLDALRALANAIEARDRYTGGHTDRVTKMAEMIAGVLGWNEKRMMELRQGCTLHDIGKIGVPDAILNKTGALDEFEANIMRKHPEMGVHIITGIDFLKSAVPYILYHHERYDGQGYPMRLETEQIPIEGRILAVVDTFDAIVSDRPYRRGAGHEKAIREIRDNRGSQFDPVIADIFLEIYENRPYEIQRLYDPDRSRRHVRDLISEI